MWAIGLVTNTHTHTHTQDELEHVGAGLLGAEEGRDGDDFDR